MKKDIIYMFHIRQYTFEIAHEIQKEGEIRASELKRKLKLHDRTLYDNLKDLIEHKIIDNINGKYSITKKGKETIKIYFKEIKLYNETIPNSIIEIQKRKYKRELTDDEIDIVHLLCQKQQIELYKSRPFNP